MCHANAGVRHGSQPKVLNEEGISVQMAGIPFGTTDWSKVEQTEHKGERGFAYWRTQQFGSIRVRMVEYTPGYLADHWCSKGHILLCMEDPQEGTCDMTQRTGRFPSQNPQEISHFCWNRKFCD